jgi:hypothetical protein
VKVFQQFDRNGNGSVDKKELLDVLRELGIGSLAPKGLREAFDADNSGTLTFDELSELVLTLQGHVAYEILNASGRQQKGVALEHNLKNPPKGWMFRTAGGDDGKRAFKAGTKVEVSKNGGAWEPKGTVVSYSLPASDSLAHNEPQSRAQGVQLDSARGRDGQRSKEGEQKAVQRPTEMEKRLGLMEEELKRASAERALMRQLLRRVETLLQFGGGTCCAPTDSARSLDVDAQLSPRGNSQWSQRGKGIGCCVPVHEV